jgi:hypothetical protein
MIVEKWARLDLKRTSSGGQTYLRCTNPYFDGECRSTGIAHLLSTMKLSAGTSANAENAAPVVGSPCFDAER